MADKESLFVAVTSLERLFGGVFIFTLAVSVSRGVVGAIASCLLHSVGNWEPAEWGVGRLRWLPESCLQRMSTKLGSRDLLKGHQIVTSTALVTVLWDTVHRAGNGWFSP